MPISPLLDGRAVKSRDHIRPIGPEREPYKQRSAYELGERFNTVMPADNRRLPGDVFEGYDDDHCQQLLDEANRDPRWNTNRETRFERKQLSSFLDDVATRATGLPSEPEPTNGVMHGPDALPPATEMTTRKARVWRILLDRTSQQVTVQRYSRFAAPTGIATNGIILHRPEHNQLIEAGEVLDGFDVQYPGNGGLGNTRSWITIQRKGYATLTEARARVDVLSKAAAERGDRTVLGEFNGAPRKLVVLRHRRVTLRPDRKGAAADRTVTYDSIDEAKLAYHRILAHLKARQIDARGWVAA